MKRIKKMTLGFFGIILILILIVCLYIQLHSPGKLPALTGEKGQVIPGSVVEKKR